MEYLKAMGKGISSIAHNPVAMKYIGRALAGVGIYSWGMAAIKREYNVSFNAGGFGLSISRSDRVLNA